MIKKWIIGSISTLVTCYAGAASAPAGFPEGLMYKGNPLSPICFLNQKADGSVSLSQCNQKHLFKTGHNAFFTDQGYIGFDYKNEPAQKIDSYAYYKVIGSLSSSYIIEFANSGGGSGNYTNLYQINIHRDTLTYHAIAMGDRCSGGIKSATINNNVLTYHVNLTPYDLMSLANQQFGLKNNVDTLSGAAIDCIATAVYSSDASNVASTKLVGVDLSAYQNQLSDLAATQPCLIKMINDSIAAGKKQLNNENFKDFANKFTAQCPQHT